MKKTLWVSVIVVSTIAALLFHACAPIREFGKSAVYDGPNDFSYPVPLHDTAKKTVIIVANNDGTELFDMIAPFYLFNATGEANVYIVARNRTPIVVKKGLFLLPQSTFSEIDSMKIQPDVIVIPFLSISDSIHQDPVIISWIKKHYTDHVSVLSICDGAATAAATGVFDGKPLTAHASDYNGIKASFSSPGWTQNVSVVNERNLYSTAGVSNATEGSLLVIRNLFGEEVMRKLIADVKYPYSEPRLEHRSETFSFGDKATVGRKIIFRKNKKLGFLLRDGINEFELAAIMDTYNRTFPKSLHSFSADNGSIKSRYGLTLIPTGKLYKTQLDELHLVGATALPVLPTEKLRTSKVITYDPTTKKYIIDECLQRIRNEYGKNFGSIVKLMLDYN